MSIETWRAERDEPGRDSELEREVWQELACQVALDASSITISVTDRAVILGGTVGTYPEKLVAQRAAQFVHGLRGIANEIVVAVAAAHEKTDRALTQAVRHALKWDVVVPADAVTATVSEGCVTLDGEVSWDYQRVAAERAVTYLWGVQAIVNRIRVTPPSRPADLEPQIRAALNHDPELQGDRILVKARGGRVQLRGHVRSLAERAEAEHDARAVPGVETVDDAIDVD
ncbi:MAG TPA: BON domain-containing protein [Gemmatimonadales bacterium]|nr:BON domain-containing protein [Gemmatimonadales bacterium]